MDLIADIKREMSILKLLGILGIQTVKSGNHLFAHSIYKQERTPSMCIYPEKNSYYCWATNQGGDVIEFYKDYYSIDTSRAVTELADLAGIKKSDYQISRTRPDQREIQKEEEKKEDLISSMTECEKEIYYERLGISDNEKEALTAVKLHRLEINKKIFLELYCYSTIKGFNQKALEYLTQERKLSLQSIKAFKLFCIDNYYETNNHLKKVFDLNDLQRSGLYNRKEDGSGNLIFYQHRLIIPYLHKGEIVYLRGRYFDQDNSTKTDRCKYIGLGNDSLNLNGTRRFFNSDVLRTMKKREKLYLVEGEFDAVALHTMGFNALCIPGVGNIPEVNQFKRLSDYRVCICVDQDEAGKKLLDNLANIFQQLKKEVTVKELPTKDINEFLIQND